MKKGLLAALTLIITVALYAQEKIDVQHYSFHIEVNDINDSIVGKAAITVKFLAPVNSFDLDLKGIQAGKGMFASSISGNNIHGFERQAEKITIFLTKTTTVGDTATFIIFYSGIPADGLIISKNKYGHRTFFADNWPNRGHNWIPCHDEPADKASVEFFVTAPAHYTVVANGILMAEQATDNNKKITHWKEEIPISAKVMVIGIADFAIAISGYLNKTIPVSSWVYPEDSSKGFYDYALASNILPFYDKMIGPYAFKKLANVQSKTIFGGLENANTIFYSESSIDGKRTAESLLAHEIAHQWFGNVATEKTFAHLWLSEGFATYMTILYFKDKYGSDTARKMLEEDRRITIDYSKKVSNPVVYETTDYMALLNPNSYQKGSWVLHMLHQQLGDSLFWKCIRTYYNRFAGKTAGTEDLEKVFEEVSAKNFSQFFRQWLYRAGQPHLNINWKYLPREKKIVVNVRQEQTGDPFIFSLDLGIMTTSGKMSTRQLSITNRVQSVKIPVKQKPSAIIADPEQALLFDGIVTELK